MTETNSPAIHLQKYKQLEELLEKNEKRAERLKVLNDQMKKQLDMEKEKNNEIHAEMSQLKQQLFKANKELREMKELYEDEKKKSESLSQELKKAEISLSTQSPNILAQPGILTQNKVLSSNLKTTLIKQFSQQNGNNNGGTIFQFKGVDGQPLKDNNDDDYSISSQSSQISDEENQNNFVERTRQRTMTISVRFNNDKGADHIRAISKSIVARNYESDYQDGVMNGVLSNPFKDIKLGMKQTIEQIKQVESNENLDGVKNFNGDSFNVEKEKKVQDDTSLGNSQDLNNSQDLPQITFNKKSSSSNKTSQFKQPVQIKFNRRMSKTHSTIRSTIEHFEEAESGVCSQNQSIKSIIIQKRSNNSMQDIPPDDQNQKSPQIKELNSSFHSPNLHSQEKQINNMADTLNHISEEGLSLSTSNVNNNQPNVTNRLFEKFFVLGCEKEDMIEFDQDPNTTEALLPGKITYSYPELNMDDPQEYVLSNSKTMIQSKFYMFTMKSSAYYDNLLTHKDQNSVINSINPHRLMYCFCFKSKDYLETRENSKSRTFWENKKVYCFVSYFPFYELFQDMLINVINQVKISRTSAYSEFENSDPQILCKLDGDCVKHIIKENMEGVFQSYRNNLVTDFQQIIMIDTLAGPVKYVIGNQYIINIQTHKWSLALSLSNISLQNLMFIFHAILLENTVIFTSKNKCLLTQTIHTFEQLMYPFSWPYPIIYLLPDSLQTLFDSPVPMIMGVNKSTKELCVEDVYDKYKDHIFFDLDYHRIYCNNKLTVKRISSEKSHLNNIYNKIEKVYQQINPQGLIQKKPSVFSDPYKKECEKHKEEYQLKYFCNKQDDQISEIILNLFNESLRQCFIDILPKKLENMILQEDNQIDYQAFAQKVLEKAYPQDRLFIQKFINTQIFTYFIENYYQFE